MLKELMFKSKLQVTDEDIATGKPKSENLCPIALALTRAIPEASYICVETGNSIKVYFNVNDDNDTCYEVFRNDCAHVINQFIALFDKEMPVKPFECELEFLIADEDRDEY